VVSLKLEHYGLKHRSSTDMMLRRMTGKSEPKSLEVLATAVQPPEGYARGALKAYDNRTPLNRLVDAVLPESDSARIFGELAKNIVAGKASAQQWAQAREWLTLWRDNDAKLQPRLNDSEITAELVPVSLKLSQVAAIGLQALDDLQNHHAVNEATLQDQMRVLKDAEKPEAVLLDMVVPSVRLLVQATGTN